MSEKQQTNDEHHQAGRPDYPRQMRHPHQVIGREDKQTTTTRWKLYLENHDPDFAIDTMQATPGGDDQISIEIKTTLLVENASDDEKEEQNVSILPKRAAVAEFCRSLLQLLESEARQFPHEDDPEWLRPRHTFVEK